MRHAALAMLILASGVPGGLKDGPKLYRATPTQQTVPLPSQAQREAPYVYIQNAGNVRLPMSWEEMEAGGYRIGDTIPLRDAHQIIERRLQSRD